MRLAILGTGTMGAGMARSAKREGLDVVVWNRTRARAEPLAADGVEVADTVTAAVTGADAVMTMLFDTDSVLAVTDELVGALAPDAVWLQAATVGPDGIGRIARAAGDVALLDAPVLGTKAPAEQGKLVPLVSGPAALIEKAGPVLDAIGTKTVVAGDTLGAGSALKLACNAWVLSITAAAAQSLALARAQDVDPQLVLDAIGGGAADSPYLQLKGGAVLDGDFTPSFELDGGRKDLALITEVAAATGVPTALLEALGGLFGRASELGAGDQDLAAVYRAFE